MEEKVFYTRKRTIIVLYILLGIFLFLPVLFTLSALSDRQAQIYNFGDAFLYFFRALLFCLIFIVPTSFYIWRQKRIMLVIGNEKIKYFCPFREPIGIYYTELLEVKTDFFKRFGTSVLYEVADGLQAIRFYTSVPEPKDYAGIPQLHFRMMKVYSTDSYGIELSEKDAAVVLSEIEARTGKTPHKVENLFFSDRKKIK